jgi:hypothetical protein
MILAIKGKEPKRELLLKLLEEKQQFLLKLLKLDRACEDNE